MAHVSVLTLPSWAQMPHRRSAPSRFPARLSQNVNLPRKEHSAFVTNGGSEMP